MKPFEEHKGTGCFELSDRAVYILVAITIILGIIFVCSYGCSPSLVKIEPTKMFKLPTGETREIKTDTQGQIVYINVNYRKSTDIWFSVKNILLMLWCWIKDIIIVTLLILFLTYIGGKIPIYGILLPKLLLSIIIGVVIGLVYIWILKAELWFGFGLSAIGVLLSVKIWDYFIKGKLKETATNLIKFKKIMR